MKRRYSLLIIFSLLFFFITSAAWSELPAANPEDVGLSSDRLNIISATLKAHIEKRSDTGRCGNGDPRWKNCLF